MPFPCPECPCTFTTLEPLGRHRRPIHRRLPAPPPAPPPSFRARSGAAVLVSGDSLIWHRLSPNERAIRQVLHEQIAECQRKAEAYQLRAASMQHLLSELDG